MNLELLFSSANIIDMLGWALLLLLPRHKITEWIIHKGILPSFLSLGYLILLVTAPPSQGGFGSLLEVGIAFNNKQILLVGWVHYLAFDMLIGAWIVRDAYEKQIKHWYLVPFLFGTFMLGPIGYLAYMLFRSYKRKRLETM